MTSSSRVAQDQLMCLEQLTESIYPQNSNPPVLGVSVPSSFFWMIDSDLLLDSATPPLALFVSIRFFAACLRNNNAHNTRPPALPAPPTPQFSTHKGFEAICLVPPSLFLSTAGLYLVPLSSEPRARGFSYHLHHVQNPRWDRVVDPSRSKLGASFSTDGPR